MIDQDSRVFVTNRLARHAGMQMFLQVLLATVLLAVQGIIGSTPAFALSSGCTQVNALSTTTTYSTFPASDFDADDKLVVSFYNDGLDSSGFEPTSDHVLVETASYSIYLVFYASDHTTASSQTVTVPAGDLSSSGLNLFVSTVNGNISNVAYSCTNASAVGFHAELSRFFHREVSHL